MSPEKTESRTTVRPDARFAAVHAGSSATAGGLKRAAMGVVAAAFRLHHYRFVRTRMLHDALDAAQCGLEAGDTPG